MNLIYDNFVLNSDMIFSKTCEYGIRACVYIAQKTMNEERATLKHIAHEINAPEAFTSKVLQQLVKHSIIESVKGASGGFVLTEKRATKTKIMDVIKALDDDIQNRGCLLGLEVCSEKNPCPVHFKFKHLKTELFTIFKTTSLYEMSLSLDKGFTFLKS